MESNDNLNGTAATSNDDSQRDVAGDCSIPENISENVHNSEAAVESSNNCQCSTDSTTKLVFHDFTQQSSPIPCSTAANPVNDNQPPSNETSSYSQQGVSHTNQLYSHLESETGAMVDYNLMQTTQAATANSSQISLTNLKNQTQPQAQQHFSSPLYFPNQPTHMNNPGPGQQHPMLLNASLHGHQHSMNGYCGCNYCVSSYSWFPHQYYTPPIPLLPINGNDNGAINPENGMATSSNHANYWCNNAPAPRVNNNATTSASTLSSNMLPFSNLPSIPPNTFFQVPPLGRDGYQPVDYLSGIPSSLNLTDISSHLAYFTNQNTFPNGSFDQLSQSQMGVKSTNDRMAMYTPVYVNQPVPNNTDHFQRKKPSKYREALQVGWINLYLEVEKFVEKPTENGRIAWLNDMHQIVYTKFTSGVYARWQYEVEFDYLRNLIEFKCDESDWIFNTYPLICKCGERFQERGTLSNHNVKCRETEFREYRCLCGRLFEEQENLFVHIFNGELECGMGAYHLWIFLEKYRKRRYKCTCGGNFSNFWVFFVHLAECEDYRRYFMKNCSHWKRDNNGSGGESGNQTQSGTWSMPPNSPLKSLVFQSKIQ